MPLVFFQKRLEENMQKLCGVTNHVYSLSKSRQKVINDSDTTPDLLSKRKEDVLCTLNGFDQTNGENDNGINHEDNLHASTTVSSGNNYGGKNALRPIKIPAVPQLPPYTTWVFLDR